MRRTEIDLFERQLQAIDSEADEVLVGGDAGKCGISFTLRVAAIRNCFHSSGVRVALVQRDPDRLQETHLEGELGLPALLSEMHAHGAVSFSPTMSEIRFANGSTIVWASYARDSDRSRLLQQQFDILLLDDAHEASRELYERLARKALTSVGPVHRVIAGSKLVGSSWCGEHWSETGDGTSREFVELLPEDLDPRMVSTRVDPPGDYESWLREMMPHLFTSELAGYHHEFWKWVWSIRPGQRVRPFCWIISRDGGKTTSAEAATAAVGARGARRYVVYVRMTQDLADESVANIAAILESEEIEVNYPALASRAVSKYGKSKAWRRDRLRTASGFVVDALGLDTAARGLKVEDQRPDMIILDDIDHKEDTAKQTLKKLRTIANTILPIGTSHVAVLAVQNLIIEDGVFGKILKQEADVIVDRVISGPHPAVHDLEYERETAADGSHAFRITGGRPSWPAKGLEAAERAMNTFGERAFLEEFQHDVGERPGALWTAESIQRCSPVAVDSLQQVAIGVDPPGGTTEAGIVAAGMEGVNRGYVLEDASCAAGCSTSEWASRSIEAFDQWQADAIIAEINYGGEMVAGTIAVEAQIAGRYAVVKWLTGRARTKTYEPRGESDGGPTRPVMIYVISASRGKQQRAQPVAGLYDSGYVQHAGHFPNLEREMKRWVPGDRESPNRVDAAVWALTFLMLPSKTKRFGMRG